MLDINTTASPVEDWKRDLYRGTVVLFRFPCAEPEADGAPKMRTCLVLDVQEIDGSHFAELAYGTSSTSSANVGYEVRVSHPDALAAAGLDYPTRFVCARRKFFPLDDAGWELGQKRSTPVIGHLDGPTTERMNAVRARLQAEQDIATDRALASRRTIKDTPTFTVEHRRRRRIVRPGKGAKS